MSKKEKKNQKKKKHGPICTFALDSKPLSIHVNPYYQSEGYTTEYYICATSPIQCYIWRYTNEENIKKGFIEPYYRFVALSRERLPIINALFSDAERVAIARAHVRPTITYEKYLNQEGPFRRLKSNRRVLDPKLSGVTKRQRQESEIVINQPKRFANFDSDPYLKIEEKSNSLSLFDLINKVDTTSRVPKSGSLQTVLQQGIRTRDKKLLEYCLSFSNPEIIDRTLTRLESKDILPLLTVIMADIDSKPEFLKKRVNWISAILRTSLAYLISTPHSRPILSLLYNKLNHRTNLYSEFRELSYSFDIIEPKESEVKIRTRVAKAPMNVFVDD